MPLPELDDDLRERLAHGAKERAAILEQIERGERPQGPRADWLRESSRRVLRVVAEECDRFQVEHPEQAPSLADALDVIWTARSALLAMAPKRPRSGGAP